MTRPIGRRVFEYLRTSVRNRRAAHRIPDDEWREASVKAGIPLERIALHRDHSLSLTLEKSTLRLPKTASGLAALSAYALLCGLDRLTQCRLAWDQGGNRLSVRWGRAVYFADCYEELYILSELYCAGDYDFVPSGPSVVIDVGANVGFTSIFLADSNPDLIVEGYEPLRVNFEKAERNLAANPHIVGRVSFMNVGLFAEDGVQTMTSGMGHRGMSSIVLDRRISGVEQVETVTVKVRRASDVVRSVAQRHPGRRVAMKMDCEGSEYAILEELGRSEALRLIDFVVMEWHRLSEDAREVEGLRDLFVAQGYHVYVRGRIQEKPSVGMFIAFKASK
jgi:FkbM family methyltransferase